MAAAMAASQGGFPDGVSFPVFQSSKCVCWQGDGMREDVVAASERLKCKAQAGLLFGIISLNVLKQHQTSIWNKWLMKQRYEKAKRGGAEKLRRKWGRKRVSKMCQSTRHCSSCTFSRRIRNGAKNSRSDFFSPSTLCDNSCIRSEGNKHKNLLAGLV